MLSSFAISQASFFFSEGERGPAAQSLDAISQHLTRALADTSGLAAVGEVVLHHVVQAVPSRMASLAVAAADGELSIVATHGYPRALVEHLRIPAGSWRHRSGSRIEHAAARCLMSPRRQVWIDSRSRYRTSSFAAVPIVAGAEVSRRCVAHRSPGAGPYTPEDARRARSADGSCGTRSWTRARAGEKHRRMRRQR